MSLKRITRLAASAGVTAGLAFGGLATVGASSASAASTSTADATYSCTNPALAGLPLLGPLLFSGFDVPAKITLSNLPDVITNNVPVPAGVPIVGTLDLSNLNGTGLAGLLSNLGITVNNLLGSTPAAPVGIAVNNLLGTISGQVATFQGTLGQFVPTDGAPLPIPTSFDASILTSLLGNLGVNCQLKPGSTITISNSSGTVTTTTVPAAAKSGATIKAKAVQKRIHKGQKAVVRVAVKTTSGLRGVGSVMAKVKGQKAKTVALKNGKTKLKFKKLKVGVNKIKLSYLGNGYTNPAKAKVKVTVLR
jgi:hypothetical protein